MPKKIVLSEEQVAYLRASHDKIPFTQLASELGMCVDSLKRFLVRLGLQEFEGAKYTLPRDKGVQLWSRPCLSCKDDRPRAKWLYFCDSCRGRQDTSVIDI